MTIHKALHPRDNMDRLDMSRKEVGRGLARTEYSVDATIQELEHYIKKQRNSDFNDQKQHRQYNNQ